MCVTENNQIIVISVYWNRVWHVYFDHNQSAVHVAGKHTAAELLIVEENANYS